MCSLLCSELQFYKKKHNLLEKKTSSVNQGPNLEVVELQNEYSVSKNQNHSSFIKGKPIFLTSIPISFFFFLWVISTIIWNKFSFWSLKIIQSIFINSHFLQGHIQVQKQTQAAATSWKPNHIMRWDYYH